MGFRLAVSLIASLWFSNACAQQLPGFSFARSGEQEMTITGPAPETSVVINAPADFHKKGKTWLIFYALPNGNSVAWTMGRKMGPGDDWHYDIQHIAAQTRLIRSLDKKNNYIVAYLANTQKSWPAWRRATASSGDWIRQLVDSTTRLFAGFQPRIVLNGHSGGGSFIFGYLNAVAAIPANVDRIAFLDSDYGYEDSLHKTKLVNWLKQDKKNNLVVLAYNDSNVIYNGKPLVSATGGTWYRSRKMQRDLAAEFDFSTQTDTAFIRHRALNGRVRFELKLNPGGLIYHTVQVERNGFIYSLLSNTMYERKKYFVYFGERAYGGFIE